MGEIIAKVSEAKARLSELVAKAEQGETVLIARGSTPVVQIVALAPKVKRRLSGRLAHWARADDGALFAPDPEQEAIDSGEFTNEVGIWIGKDRKCRNP